MSHAHPHKPSLNDAYEKTDARANVVLKYGFWIAVSTALSIVAMWGTFKLLAMIDFDDGGERHPLADGREVPRGPLLETEVLYPVDRYKQYPPAEDPHDPTRLAEVFTVQTWRDVKLENEKKLSSYGWIDPQVQIVRVPIQRAIEIALQKNALTSSKKTN